MSVNINVKFSVKFGANDLKLKKVIELSKLLERDLTNREQNCDSAQYRQTSITVVKHLYST